MTVSNVTALLDAGIDTVWQVVTDTANYGEWRSDLKCVDVEDELRFNERSRDGFVTRFAVTQLHAPQLWEFSMENVNLTGRWQGVFEPCGGKTAVSFTEYVSAKKLYMRPFVRLYLQKQQQLFVYDLKRELLRRKEQR